MRGLGVRWEIGPRSLVTGMNQQGKVVVRNGKNGGPVIQQLVVKVLFPKVGV